MQLESCDFRDGGVHVAFKDKAERSLNKMELIAGPLATDGGGRRVGS
jgi:hypothetical protein